MVVRNRKRSPVSDSRFYSQQTPFISVQGTCLRSPNIHPGTRAPLDLQSSLALHASICEMGENNPFAHPSALRYSGGDQENK